MVYTWNIPVFAARGGILRNFLVGPDYSVVVQESEAADP